MPTSTRKMRKQESGGLAFDGVTVTLKLRKQPPRTVVDGAGARSTKGGVLAILGPSGAGKSSMLRAIAGLWTRGSGIVTRPLTADTMFLPQRPYCTLGSLRPQLVYPRAGDDCTPRRHSRPRPRRSSGRSWVRT